MGVADISFTLGRIVFTSMRTMELLVEMTDERKKIDMKGNLDHLFDCLRQTATATLQFHKMLNELFDHLVPVGTTVEVDLDGTVRRVLREESRGVEPDLGHFFGWLNGSELRQLPIAGVLRIVPSKEPIE